MRPWTDHGQASPRPVIKSGMNNTSALAPRRRKKFDKKLACGYKAETKWIASIASEGAQEESVKLAAAVSEKMRWYWDYRLRPET
jgi:hypothetical protein